MKKKIFALSLATAILGMTAACTTARNDGANTGTMASSSAQDNFQQETGALGNLDTDSTMTNTNYNNTDSDANKAGTTTYNHSTTTEADNLNSTYNGAVLDDTDKVVGGAVGDVTRGVTDVVEDAVDGTRETGVSGTDTMR